MKSYMKNVRRNCAFAGAWRPFVVLPFAILACVTVSAAQSAPPASAVKTASAPGATQATSADAQKPANSKLKKMVQEHKVLTNEDFESSHAKETEPAKSGGEQKIAAPSGNGTVCDDECANEARERVDLDEDQEGEWQSQLAEARHFIATDASWKDAYWKGFDSTRTYCGFQRQLQNTATPSGNDYHSRYERAKREQYVQQMGHTLSFNAQSASERLNRMIEEAENTDPVRAAVMSVLADRALNQCADPIDP